VTAAEALALVTALGESRRGAGSSPIASSEHIRLTALDAVAESVPRGAAGNGDFQPLVDVWNTILDERRCDMNAVELTAIALARTIDRHSGSLVTLATLKAHDDYTVTHITNVALLAMALGEAVDLSPAAVTDLGMAALLHDIGKLRVPAEILNAPGRLTDEQAAIIKRHPEDGARILLATPGVSELAVAVAYEHHVQYDGGGYPAVRPGWRLNLASAITTIADVYDALRSDRPYRKGLPPAEVHAIMSREAGTVFAPGLLQAFLSHVAPRTRIAPAAQPEPADRLSA
jgi:putative nucleotidyltransferase with HDIG domain